MAAIAGRLPLNMLRIALFFPALLVGAADIHDALTPVTPNFSPGPEYADSTRQFQGIPGLEGRTRISPGDLSGDRPVAQGGTQRTSRKARRSEGRVSSGASSTLRSGRSPRCPIFCGLAETTNCSTRSHGSDWKPFEPEQESSLGASTRPSLAGSDSLRTRPPEVEVVRPSAGRCGRRDPPTSATLRSPGRCPGSSAPGRSRSS